MIKGYRLRSFLAGCMAIVLACSSLWGNPKVVSGNTTDELAQNTSDLRQEYTDVVLNSSELEEAYSSVEKGYVTSVKNQGSNMGTCWAFAAVSAMESYALAKGLVTGPEEIDLSEYALIYLTYNDKTYVDSFGKESEDYTEATNIKNAFLSGGNDNYAFKTLSKWAGVMSEEKAPYGSGITNLDNLPEVEYSLEDIEYILINQYFIPMSESASVKQVIKENGGVTAYYNSDKVYSNNYEEGEIIYPEYYHYTYTGTDADHAITIVGWDDTISKENFTVKLSDEEQYTPQNDGAWLVKNSWGTDFGNEGYMWISYEDTSIIAAQAGVYEIESADAYQYNYQHDKATVFGDVIGDYEISKYANVFEISSEEIQILKAVSFALVDDNRSYSIQIYRGPATDNPEEGIPMLEEPITGELKYPGYYTIDIGEEILLENGDSFAVVISFNEATNIVIASDSRGEIGLDASLITNVCGDNESYVEIDGEYTDIYDVNGEDGFNLCIKAFTVDKIFFGVEEVADATYSGEAIMPKPVVSFEGIILEESLDYTLTYENNVEAGTATIVITGIEQYAGISGSATFEILPKVIDEFEVSGIVDKVYNGQAQGQENIRVIDGEKELIKGTDYTLDFEGSNNTDIGNVTFLIVGNGNYTGTIEKNFRIAEKGIGDVVISGIENAVYSGEEITLDISVTEGENILEEGIDYLVEYQENVTAGTAKVIISGIGTYCGSVVKAFEITPKELAFEELIIESHQYTGEQIMPEVVISDGDYELIPDIDYTLSYGENLNVGKGSVTITCQGNYQGSTTVEFDIIQRNISDMTMEPIANVIYTGEELKPQVTIKHGDKLLVEGVDFLLTYSNNVEIGIGEILIEGMGNYDCDTTVYFRIVRYDIKDAIVDDIDEYVYTGNYIKPSVVVSFEGVELEEDTDYEVSYKANSGVGTATVIITGINEYGGVYEKNFDIVPKDISDEDITIAEMEGVEYTGRELTPIPTITYNGMMLNNEIDFGVRYDNNTEIGVATMEIYGRGNYTGITTVTFEIVEDVPKAITSDVINVNQETGIISKITVGMTAGELLQSINEDKYIVVYKNGQPVEENTLLGTGMTICIVKDDEVRKMYTVIVTGDTNGDGKINITDMMAIKAHILKKTELTGNGALASDTNGDGKINITDFIKSKATILKKDTITGVIAG